MRWEIVCLVVSRCLYNSETSGYAPNKNYREKQEKNINYVILLTYIWKEIMYKILDVIWKYHDVSREQRLIHLLLQDMLNLKIEEKAIVLCSRNFWMKIYLLDGGITTGVQCQQISL